jgi:hypothetical protein
LWNPGSDTPQIHRRDDWIATAGRGESRRANARELAVVSIAAEPGIFSRNLSISRGTRNVKVSGDLTALAGALKPT